MRDARARIAQHKSTTRTRVYLAQSYSGSPYSIITFTHFIINSPYALQFAVATRCVEPCTDDRNTHMQQQQQQHSTESTESTMRSVLLHLPRYIINSIICALYTCFCCFCYASFTSLAGGVPLFIQIASHENVLCSLASNYYWISILRLFSHVLEKHRMHLLVLLVCSSVVVRLKSKHCNDSLLAWLAGNGMCMWASEHVPSSLRVCCAGKQVCRNTQKSTLHRLS